MSHGPVGVGVEGVGSWRAQRRPHNIEISAPLSGVAAHELESSVDGATFNPVAAAATTSTRCSLVKNTLKTPLSSSTFLPVNANIRPRLYLGSVIAETSKEDAMEPEVKEEDERRSSTPSPEVIFIFSFFFNLLFLSYLYVLILSLVYMIYFFPYSISSILINSQFMHDMMCD